jgi:hypothetical protein
VDKVELSVDGHCAHGDIGDGGSGGWTQSDRSGRRATVVEGKAHDEFVSLAGHPIWADDGTGGAAWDDDSAMDANACDGGGVRAREAAEKVAEWIKDKEIPVGGADHEELVAHGAGCDALCVQHKVDVHEMAVW